jgi:hypothetical protein
MRQWIIAERYSSPDNICPEEFLDVLNIQYTDTDSGSSMLNRLSGRLIKSRMGLIGSIIRIGWSEALAARRPGMANCS